MKLIGLIGGMSWESSAEYYRMINQTVRNKLGGQHSARSLMWSVDFHDIESMQHEGRWDAAAEESSYQSRSAIDQLVISVNQVVTGDKGCRQSRSFVSDPSVVEVLNESICGFTIST